MSIGKKPSGKHCQTALAIRKCSNCSVYIFKLFIYLCYSNIKSFCSRNIRQSVLTITKDLDWSTKMKLRWFIPIYNILNFFNIVYFIIWTQILKNMYSTYKTTRQLYNTLNYINLISVLWRNLCCSTIRNGLEWSVYLLYSTHLFYSK